MSDYCILNHSVFSPFSMTRTIHLWSAGVHRLYNICMQLICLSLLSICIQQPSQPFGRPYILPPAFDRSSRFLFTSAMDIVVFVTELRLESTSYNTVGKSPAIFFRFCHELPRDVTSQCEVLTSSSVGRFQFSSRIESGSFLPRGIARMKSLARFFSFS